MYVSTTKFKFVIFTKTMSDFVAKSQKTFPANTAEKVFPELQFSRFQLGQHLVQAGAFHGIQAAHLIVGGEQIWHHDGDKAPAAPARTPL